MTKTKAEMVKEARRRMQARHPDLDEHGGCVAAAHLIIEVAAENGVRLVLQAGTCYWPRVTAANDDGVEPNVFGYEWEPGSLLTRQRLAAGLLPELHVWAGDPATGEVVDLTTRSFPVQCRRILGVRWKAPTPPDFLWTRVPPRGVEYTPYANATLLVVALWRQSLAQSSL